MKRIPRPEHPNPQFLRENFLNLNGTWQFEIDNGATAENRELYKKSAKLKQSINVPFCPESKLSGVKHIDQMAGVVYKRSVFVTPEQLEGLIFINFGAVDYSCVLYVNEKRVGEHKGGYVSFKFNITEFLEDGFNDVTLIVKDDSRNPMIPSGKQSGDYYSVGCYYTRTTGIWQTVWLEYTPKKYIESIKYSFNSDFTEVFMETELVGDGEFAASVFFNGKKVGSGSLKTYGGRETLIISLSETHLWDLGQGNLYDVKLNFEGDEVKSYFGMRSVKFNGYKFLLNGRSVFQRTVLDQGFYPDGIYTAPTEKELEKDTELSLSCGFNGAKKKKKIFEPRFLYHCDRLGYMVWGEYPSWGLDNSDPQSIYSILPEWMAEIKRDFNHPSIIGWCPQNESWHYGEDGRRHFKPAIQMIYDITKALDSTRPCIDVSGGFQVAGDAFDIHTYDQNPESFNSYFKDLPEDKQTLKKVWMGSELNYDGKKPVFVSEFGGMLWSENKENAWGYGDGPKTEEEFVERFRGLSNCLLNNPYIFGLCYTQLTDVEQEQNGLFYYNREPKFSPQKFKDILSQKAAIED